MPQPAQITRGPRKRAQESPHGSAAQGACRAEKGIKRAKREISEREASARRAQGECEASARRARDIPSSICRSPAVRSTHPGCGREGHPPLTCTSASGHSRQTPSTASTSRTCKEGVRRRAGYWASAPPLALAQGQRSHGRHPVAVVAVALAEVRQRPHRNLKQVGGSRGEGKGRGGALVRAAISLAHTLALPRSGVLPITLAITLAPAGRPLTLSSGVVNLRRPARSRSLSFSLSSRTPAPAPAARAAAAATALRKRTPNGK
jgi:hypothetical protein